MVMKIAVPALLTTLAFMAPVCPGPPNRNACKPVHGDPEGDVSVPGIDITTVVARHDEHATGTASKNTDPDVTLTFLTPWPPNELAYSWYVKITMHSTDPEPNGTTIEIIKQRHDGVEELLIDGVPTEDVNFAEETDGKIYLRVYRDAGEPWDPRNATIEVETGYLETSGGTIEHDYWPDDQTPVPMCP